MLFQLSISKFSGIKAAIDHITFQWEDLALRPSGAEELKEASNSSKPGTKQNLDLSYDG